ncbi:MAG: hypothetical protein KKD56_08725 [Acidobacteria bacterium]|nr:hypothetical protein [Acidobacteriota bacterium]MCG2816461.1 hypothetical protein [Candidatus Aminicenantes bacterium]MBU1339137.1 hypothetical protein [Acidobacteriota bacterium]MBU1475497.1 hypothetical protein [Acidobacteriota bacterium]MBU2439310.1 hypothetical protein [Acidobacteriota bacterium]
MPSHNLLIISGIAFLFVFIILAVLAVIMRLIIIIFPEKQSTTDSAVLAAVFGAVMSRFPGTKILKVEEQK